ncbi:hypothetical protein H257_15947 [Aphanomyces astaci]|uniref:Uncharacterized protein n=2 Tax=Aphanomyces astaci TaxID=112090 RepID=W4FMR9_APHAT|nr:hypothetical protein H257_15947 [Aphanomyces astaci]ETV67983.1 hypothetical protein H257_15947 [Aphanomyces astaci]|eukprot:XP_009842546.1 hypothetical protein H257_15947 [Aphanomyces astaci]
MKRSLVVVAVVTAAASTDIDMACTSTVWPVLGVLRKSTEAAVCVKALIPESPPKQLTFLDIPYENRTDVIHRMAELKPCQAWFDKATTTIRAITPPCVYTQGNDSYATSTFNLTFIEYLDRFEWPWTGEHDNDQSPRPTLFKPVNTKTPSTGMSTSPTTTTTQVASKAASFAPPLLSYVLVLVLIAIVYGG